jgi:hypothetical protein
MRKEDLKQIASRCRLMAGAADEFTKRRLLDLARNTKHGLKANPITPFQKCLSRSPRRRRASERKPHNRSALLRIAGLTNLFELTVRDISDRGIGVRLHINLPLLPVDFKISDDGFRTARKCRLIWRQSNFIGAEFVD